MRSGVGFAGVLGFCGVGSVVWEWKWGEITIGPGTNKTAIPLIRLSTKPTIANIRKASDFSPCQGGLCVLGRIGVCLGGGMSAMTKYVLKTRAIPDKFPGSPPRGGTMWRVR